MTAPFYKSTKSIQPLKRRRIVVNGMRGKSTAVLSCPATTENSYSASRLFLTQCAVWSQPCFRFLKTPRAMKPSIVSGIRRVKEQETR